MMRLPHSRRVVSPFLPFGFHVLMDVILLACATLQKSSGSAMVTDTPSQASASAYTLPLCPGTQTRVTSFRLSSLFWALRRTMQWFCFQPSALMLLLNCSRIMNAATSAWNAVTIFPTLRGILIHVLAS